MSDIECRSCGGRYAHTPECIAKGDAAVSHVEDGFWFTVDSLAAALGTVHWVDDSGEVFSDKAMARNIIKAAKEAERE